MQTETKEQSSLIKFEEVNALITNAPEVLAKNQRLHDAALAKAIALQDTIEGQGMSDELDEAVNDWMVKAKQALDINLSRRSPITQMLTQITKTFTALEAPFDGTKKDSYYATFQIHRNAWAKKKAELKKVKEAEILRNQNIEKEKISIKAEIESQLRSRYYDKLEAFKKYWTDIFNNTTLDTIKENKEKIENIKLDYPKDKFNELPVNVSPIYLNNVETDRMIGVAKVELYQELSANFTENMEALKQELKDKFPSKQRELKAIASAASAELQQAMIEQAAKRQREEEAEGKRKDDEKRKADEDKIKLDKQMATAGSLFDTQAQLAEIKESTGKVREGYTIAVTEPAGWGAIFLFWFEKEGQTMTSDQIEKKTFKQLKSFAEKYAHKHNEKIDNDAVIYEEEYKAVTTKA